MAFRSSSTLSPFAQHLVKEEILTEVQAYELADQARADETPFSIFLEQKKWVNTLQLAEAASYFFSLPLYDLSVHQTRLVPTDFLSLPIVQKQYAIPLIRHDNTIFFGVIDPETINVNEIAFTTGTQIKLIIVEGDKLRTVLTDIEEAQSLGGPSLPESKLEPLEHIDATPYADTAPETTLQEKIDDAPVVAYVNKLITEAIKIRASDIHFEPFEKDYRIRYRVDGILYEASRSPIQIAGPMVARLKVIANLDIAEHRVPQDGRFKITLSHDKSVDFRISTCPTLFGEKIVLRLLDPEAMPLDIDLLGMEEHQKKIFLDTIHTPQGIILVTGPTGSGKTITLYTALDLLNSVQKNICTVEDPIEIYMPGINQVHMNMKTGLSFAKAMRAFLRQDPDIIMVGEIRDLETADIAIKAAETGHLVLSTVHTNSASMTLARLANIGIDGYNIAGTVSLIVAQRLIRKLCEHCKKPIKLDKEILLQQGFSEEDIPKLKLYTASQCSKCNHGYKGRVGIFEMMPISDEMRNLILHNADVIQLTQQAKKEGILNLHETGLIKIKAGITNLEELNRVV